jgi:hypothetical protein
MVIRLSALRTCRIYPQEILVVLISVGGWVDPRAIVRSEGFMSMKNSMTPSGIETATFWFVAQYPYVHTVKVKQSCYRPGVAQRFPGSYGSQISWQRHRMAVRLSALRTCRIYPQEILLVLISVRGWFDPRAIVRSEGFMSMKNSMTPPEIKPATFWFLAQYLNHCATSVLPLLHVVGYISAA